MLSRNTLCSLADQTLMQGASLVVSDCLVGPGFHTEGGPGIPPPPENLIICIVSYSKLGKFV